jgi:hypothetical protein
MKQHNAFFPTSGRQMVVARVIDLDGVHNRQGLCAADDTAGYFGEMCRHCSGEARRHDEARHRAPGRADGTTDMGRRRPLYFGAVGRAPRLDQRLVSILLAKPRHGRHFGALRAFRV